MKIEDILVSIIVPFYNVEDYLEECLASIQAQNHKNIQVIVVDDGSVDGSPAICDKFAKQDARFVAVHQKNSGPSTARNTGLSRVEGEYFAYVDSDDILHQDYVKALLELAVSTGSNLVECGFCRTKSALRKASVSEEIEIYDDAEFVLYEALYNRLLSVRPWTKLYKTSDYVDIKYADGKLYEGVYYTPIVATRVTRYAKTTRCLYFYRRREGSIMNSGFDPRNRDRIEMCLVLRDDLLGKYSEKIDDAANARVLRFLCFEMQKCWKMSYEERCEYAEDFTWREELYLRYRDSIQGLPGVGRTQEAQEPPSLMTRVKGFFH